MRKSLSKNEIRKKASDYLLNYCGSLNQNEKLLLIYDETTENLIPLLENAAARVTTFIEKTKIEILSQHGLEPPLNVSKKMLESKHAVTRKESVKFVQTIYGFTQSLAVFDFSSLKPAMKKEIDDAVANQSKLTALKDDADSKKNDNNMKTSLSANVDTTNNNGIAGITEKEADNDYDGLKKKVDAAWDE